MANRAYLYASNHLPDSAAWLAKRELHGIAEWNYAVPLAFKLLLGSDPVAVKSSIWDTPELIAIAGDASSGVQRLFDYLARLPAEADALAAEAREFLSRPDNARRYFILEGCEIFQLQEEGSLEELNLALKAEIEALGTTTIELPPPAIVASGAETQHDPLASYYRLGLGNWSNILYFQFG